MRLTLPDRADLRHWAPLALPLLCLLASVPLKLAVDAGGPLWLDEGWTLAIVQAPLHAAAGPSFFDQLAWDPNPPFYFVTLKAWTWLAGLSNGALRTPSVLAALCAPLFAFLPGAGLARRECWLWAALLALWIPGVFFAQEARSYALLFALEVGAAAALLRLLQRPSLASACLWSGLTALAVLTHAHAVIVGGLQGLAILWVLRRRSLRLWPALLLLVPSLAWMLLHAPRVAQFARPEFAWYAPLTLSGLLPAVDFAFGGRLMAMAAAVLMLVGLLLRRLPPRRGEPAPPAVLWAPVVCAAAGVTLVIGLGFLRPSFTVRYLTAFAPGLLLALPLGLAAAARSRAGVLAATLMLLALFSGAVMAASADPMQRRLLQYETASRDLMRAGAPRVAFLWDSATNRVLTPPQRLALARAFLDRAGYRGQVEALVTGPDDDPAAALYAAAPQPGDGYIWLYDTHTPGAAAIAHPPRPSPLRPHLDCRLYAPDVGSIGVLACRRTETGGAERGLGNSSSAVASPR